MKLWCRFVSCAFVIGLTVSLPVTTVEPDQASTSPDSVPLEFPNFNQNYIFVDNSSIRENLASHTDIDTEVDDLLAKNAKENGEKPPTDEEGEDQPKNEETLPNPSEEDEDVGRKGVIEWIEDGDDTEDEKFVAEANELSSTTEKIESPATSEETEVVQSSTTTETVTTTTEKPETETSQKFTTETIVVSAKQTGEPSEPYAYGIPLIDGTVAAILVGIFLVVCIFGYTALIIWRRSLELKYGSREMLVDKDDFLDPDDLKHFSI